MIKNNPMETARKAYSGEDKPTPDMPQGKVPQGMRPVEMDRQGMSLVDKAVAEMRDREAGTATSPTTAP